MFRVCNFFLLLFLIFVPQVHAADGDWSVARVSKVVNYTLDKQTWIRVKQDDVIPNNAWISTGPRARLQLIRGSESLVFQPNTMAGIYVHGFFNRKTDIVQQAGTIDLKIERRSLPHTSVQTPFLAAVVKGTSFRVTVGKSAAAVSVRHGAVEVTAFAGGERSRLGPGDSAAVRATTGMRVSGANSKPAMWSVEPSVARVPALGKTTLVGAKKLDSSPKRTSAGQRDKGPGGNSSKDRADGKNNHERNASSNTNSNGNSQGNGQGNGNGKGEGNKSGKGKGNGR